MTSTLRLMRWTDTLLAIHRTRENQSYCERLCRVLRCSRTHIRVVANMLLEQGLIEVVPVKNVKRLALTEKGKRITESLLAIKAEL